MLVGDSHGLRIAYKHVTHIGLRNMKMANSTLQALTSIQPNLPVKPVYTLDEFASAIGRSKKTAYRYLLELKRSGFVIASYRGRFSLRESAFLPASIIPQILPLLLALKDAKSFRLRNGKTGVTKAMALLKEQGGFLTLDYAAFELTGYQTPETLYFYPDDFDRAVSLLKSNGYVESSRGKTILLPKTGDFSNPILRVFFDCLAVGGRGTLDAIAIARKYPDETKPSGYFHFLLDLASKVEQDTGVGYLAANTR